MTKAQLIKALEGYSDDTPIIVASINDQRGHGDNGVASLDTLANCTCPNGDAVQLMTTEFVAQQVLVPDASS